MNRLRVNRGECMNRFESKGHWWPVTFVLMASEEFGSMRAQRRMAIDA